MTIVAEKNHEARPHRDELLPAGKSHRQLLLGSQVAPAPHAAPPLRQMPLLLCAFWKALGYLTTKLVAPRSPRINMELVWTSRWCHGLASAMKMIQ